MPEDILKAWRSAGRQAAAKRQAWNGRLSALEAAKRDAFERTVAGDLPADFDIVFEAYKKELAENPPKLATRQASQKALNVLTKAVPEMIGGSADRWIEPDIGGRHGGRRWKITAALIYYGVREHGCRRNERHGIAWRAYPVRRNFPRLHRLLPAIHSAVSLDETTRHLRDDSRFDRPW